LPPPSREILKFRNQPQALRDGGDSRYLANPPWTAQWHHNGRK
jgi:hypothetical protein